MMSGERSEMTELFRSLSESFRSQQEYDGKKYYCTISAGSASYPEDASCYTDLSKYASHSLKHAKKFGRNQIVFFQPRHPRTGNALSGAGGIAAREHRTAV